MSVVLVSRRPVFPSLAVVYKDSGQTGQKESPRGLPKLPHISARPRTASEVTPKQEAPAAAKRATSQGSTYYEQEQLRRRVKRAEAMQREWDVIQQSERDRKKVILEQRVKIQRQLISKTDVLSKQLWTAAERKKLKEVEERRRERADVARALRDHIRKIEEHKIKVAERLSEMDSKGDLTSDYPVPPPTGHTQEGEKGPVQSHADHQHTTSGHVPAQQETYDALETRGPEASVNIEEVWDGLRAKTAKKLEMITTHSNMLKKSISSPSAKLCLQIYEGPTAHSSTTGRPVPFTELISSRSEVRERSGGVRSTLLAASIRLKEQKAQYMMSKKEPPVAPQGGGPEWYGLAPPPPPATIPSPHSTTNANQIPCPLLELDDMCGVDRESPTTAGGGMDWGPEGSLTDDGVRAAQVDGTLVPRGSTQATSGSVFITEPPTAGGDRARTSGWQPLSHTALTEHTSVSELPVHGIGDLGHGKYKMWRPY